ncbi:MAG: PAS domain S-box protein [Geminicoccaceae bacterium]
MNHTGAPRGSAPAGEPGSLDSIVRLLAHLLGVPIAAVTMAAGDRLVVAASVGCPFDELPRHGSLPGCTLDRGGPELIEDLLALDPPLPVPVIDGRPLRFYAGLPIRGPEGELVGTLCAADFRPRRIDTEAEALLAGLAGLAGDQLRLARELATHRELARALEEGERRLRDFAETASDWFWEMDAELRFSWMSDSVRTRFGFDPAWHYGKTRMEIAATEADREVALRIQELMLRREPFRDVEYCRRSPTGDHWLRISGKPVFDAAGRFLGYRGTGRDVTELKRAETARRVAEERYRRLVEQSPDGVVIHREGRLLFANAKAIEILGGSRLEDVLGISTLDLCEPAVRPLIAERIRRLAVPGTVLEPFEFRIRRLDGRWIDVETRGVAVVEDGHPAAQVVIHDISERKALEARLREAEARYRTLFKLSPDGIFVKDAKHRILFANRAAAQLFGLADPADLIGRSSLAFLCPEGRALVEARSLRLLTAGGSVPPVELRLCGADGEVRVVEAVATRLDEKGEPRILVVQRDITERKKAEAARLEAEARYRTLVELSPDALLVLQDGRYVFANRRALELLGTDDPAAIVGKRPRDLYLEDQVPLIEARIERMLADGGTVPPLEARIRRLDGEIRDIETSGAAILFDGKPAIQVAIRDITERKRAEAARREAEARYRALVELNPDPVILVEDGRFVFASEPAARLFGLADAGELIGRSIFEFLPEELHATVRARHVTALRGGEVLPPLELEIVRPDGARVEIEAKGSLVIRNGRRMLLGVWRDVTERKALEAELRRLAYHDPLTGLPNRALFFDRLVQALQLAAREERLGALLLLDLDGFKQVNDGLGHDAGDALLRGVARRLRRVIRRSDTVARLAGDEFALLLYPIRDPATVERVAERIRAVLAVPVRHRGRTLRAEASVGAALFPTDGTNIDTLFKHADLALYRAKAEGRGGLAMVDDAMRLAFARRIRLGEELREAVEAGRFELRHEPRVALDDGRPLAVEAVPFWSPVGAEPIFGAALLDLANECGVAAKLALETLGRALDACLARDRMGLPPLAVAVDVPIGLLTTEGGVARALRLLEDRGLPPQRLLLELDEAAFGGRDRGPVLDAVARLREAGVRVILDRFGLGACSLKPVLERRVDGINLLAEPSDGREEPGATEALAASVVELATRFGMQVTALGVASEDARRALAALGCHAGQGPLWSGPVAAEALVELLGRSAPGPCACALSGAPCQPRPSLTGRLPDP